MPNRIQLRRTKGWRKPEGAIVVARPSKWGNPFIVGRNDDPELWPYLVDPCNPNADRIRRSLSALSAVKLTAQQAVDAYAWWIIEQPHLMLSLNELAGSDLACWCRRDRPCHADVLLELANGGS